jgi:hypothetical protein
MITGFNQDVNYKGKVYHVQTEDRGIDNPIIESLIYVGGEILASKKTSYKEIMDEDGFDEPRIAALLEKQHRRIVVDIKLGKYTQEEPKAFGEGLVTNRSLDEVILDYLNSEGEKEQISVTLTDQTPFVAGESARIQLRAAGDFTQLPIDGAAVQIQITTSDGATRELFNGKTNSQGDCTASFAIPLVQGNAVVIIQVEHAKGSFESKALVTKKKS